MTPELREAVVEVHGAAEELGIRAVLIGALVMEFTTEIKEDYPDPKQTFDADFAVYTETWDSYRRLRGALENLGFKRHPHIEQRHKKGGVIVDLIPYGGLAEKGAIHWPETEFEMSVIGFEEVCAAATEDVREGLPKVPVISVPGFVLLKIIAFQDRYDKRHDKYSGDAKDIYYWLENYATLTNGDDRGMEFVLARGWQEDVGGDCAGAALLGHEVGKLASEAAAERAERFLRDCASPESAFVQTVLANEGGFYQGEDGGRYAAELKDKLAAFRRGFAG